VVAQAGRHVDEPSILAFLQGRVAKWSIPDRVIVVDELPHTATGKVSKRTLRERYTPVP
jgi:acyl-CoA synthetase (AMP-forming)/AMP-acid ligase II